MKTLKLPALIFFLLALSYNVNAQYASPSRVCYGSPIYLFCGGGPGCGVPGASYSWSDPMGSWTSSLKDPVIPVSSVGYHTGEFYLSNMYPPGHMFAG